MTIHLTTSNNGVLWDVTTPLYTDEGKAKWFVHPAAGEQVDIAVLPLPSEFLDPPGEIERLAQPFNSLDFQTLQVEVSEDLFVIGFPRNLSQNGMPIWKRANLASEPGMFADLAGRRQLYVDCASRQGMSGSPVVVVHRGMFRPYGGTAVSPGTAFDFLGIYSGRLVDKDENPFVDDFIAAQIGIVWPRALIEKVVYAGIPDNFERLDTFTATVEG